MVKSAPSTRSQAPSRVALLRMMQEMNFGRIERLSIVDGHPILDPVPTIVREIKFGGDNAPRSERGIGEFLLKQQVVELFAFFDQVPNGIVETLEVKHGLPFRLTYSAPTT